MVIGVAGAQMFRSEFFSYVFPLCAAVFLHALVFWVFAGGLEGWMPGKQPEQRVYKVVKASLVTIEPKKKSVRAVTKTKVKPKIKPKKPARPTVKDKPVVKEKAKELVKENSKEAPEETVTQSNADLLNELFAEEDAALRQEEELDEVQRYSAMIKQMIEQSWSRPPSARRNMEAELKINLVPSGDIVSVNVDKSSGNVAFDRSAILAVERVGRFDILQGMPSDIFEKYFRHFTFIFKPEDLRL